MKLLILTQIVDINDDVLGFMHGWIAALAQKCVNVTVICLKMGEHNLPENVKVVSLGKERAARRFNKIKYLFRFYQYIWRERKNYDIVFVHMNHEYVILGGIFWRLLGKKIGLWYAHGYAPPSLILAEKLAHHIFTSTTSGFRLKSNKINVVGQGIDTDKFASRQAAESSGCLKIISVGRIAPSKDYLTLIKAVDLLNKAGLKFKIEIIGGVILAEHENYLTTLKETINQLGLSHLILFRGSIPFRQIVQYLQDNDLLVNMSHTGSLDKVILEAMACELPILTCNEALNEVLGQYQDKLMYEKGDFQALAAKIMFINNLPPQERLQLGQDLRQLVVNHHSLSALADKILSTYEQKNQNTLRH